MKLSKQGMYGTQMYYGLRVAYHMYALVKTTWWYQSVLSWQYHREMRSSNYKQLQWYKQCLFTLGHIWAQWLSYLADRLFVHMNLMKCTEYPISLFFQK